jgi:drug/metabolite transporter (DMT)-like permease
MTSLPQKNVVGILCAVGGAFVFSFNDMAIKFLSGSYALHEVVLFRSAIGLLFLMMVIVPFEGGFQVLKTRRLPAHLFRGLCVVFSNMTFFLAIAALPLAEAVAIFFISPILITIFGAIFLGEKIGPRRAVAAVVGLAGVIVMQRPGFGTFQIASLLPLAAALGYAALHVMTRKIGGTEKAATMAVYIQLTFIIVSGAMGLAVGDGRFNGGGDASLDFLLRAGRCRRSRTCSGW